ncbi:MAG: hypothetical protein VKJ04_00075 [Vampirovibrionales bacterium]|nr:hypothetical protein [Vampirovibrionales bacterium]
MVGSAASSAGGGNSLGFRSVQPRTVFGDSQGPSAPAQGNTNSQSTLSQPGSDVFTSSSLDLGDNVTAPLSGLLYTRGVALDAAREVRAEQRVADDTVILPPEEAAAEQVVQALEQNHAAFRDASGSQGAVGGVANWIKNSTPVAWFNNNGSDAVQRDFEGFRAEAEELRTLAQEGRMEEFRAKYRELNGFDYDPEYPVVDENHPALQAQIRFDEGISESIAQLQANSGATDMDDRIQELQAIQVGDVGDEGYQAKLQNTISELEENLNGKGEPTPAERTAIEETIARLRGLEGDTQIVSDIANSTIGRSRERSQDFSASQQSWVRGLSTVTSVVTGVVAAGLIVGGVVGAPFTGGVSLAASAGGIALGAGIAGGVAAGANAGLATLENGTDGYIEDQYNVGEFARDGAIIGAAAGVATPFGGAAAAIGGGATRAGASTLGRNAFLGGSQLGFRPMVQAGIVDGAIADAGASAGLTWANGGSFEEGLTEGAIGLGRGAAFGAATGGILGGSISGVRGLRNHRSSSTNAGPSGGPDSGGTAINAGSSGGPDSGGSGSSNAGPSNGSNPFSGSTNYEGPPPSLWNNIDPNITMKSINRRVIRTFHTDLYTTPSHIDAASSAAKRWNNGYSTNNQYEMAKAIIEWNTYARSNNLSVIPDEILARLGATVNV